MCKATDPLQGYFPNEKTKNMNEYAGFKVGDKVKIIESSSDILHCFKNGTKCEIQRLYTNRQGDEIAVCFDGRIGQLVSVFGIKKLPKYSVGDKVRTKCGHIITIGKIYSDGHYLPSKEMNSCFTEDYLSPFDGFRVGDVVYTEKRGKGKIVSKCNYTPQERCFFVRFDDDSMDRNPKTSNLLTEHEYKERQRGGIFISCGDPIMKCQVAPSDLSARYKNALNNITQAINAAKQAEAFAAAFSKVFADKPSGGVSAPASLGEIKGTYFYESVLPSHYYASTEKGEMTVTEETVLQQDGFETPLCKQTWVSKFGVGDIVVYGICSFEVIGIEHKDGKFFYLLKDNILRIGEDYLSYPKVPLKFKVGDVVFFKGEKWFVDYLFTWIPNLDYQITKGENSVSVKESDIRLWKETELKYSVCMLGDVPTVAKACQGIVRQDKLSFIGSKDGVDIFKYRTVDNQTKIYYGIKGDDIK